MSPLCVNLYKGRNFNIVVGVSEVLPCVNRSIISKLATVFSATFFVFVIVVGRGGIVVRAHASRAEGLRFEPDSIP